MAEAGGRLSAVREAASVSAFFPGQATMEGPGGPRSPREAASTSRVAPLHRGCFSFQGRRTSQAIRNRLWKGPRGERASGQRAPADGGLPQSRASERPCARFAMFSVISSRSPGPSAGVSSRMVPCITGWALHLPTGRDVSVRGWVEDGWGAVFAAAGLGPAPVGRHAGLGHVAAGESEADGAS